MCVVLYLLNPLLLCCLQLLLVSFFQPSRGMYGGTKSHITHHTPHLFPQLHTYVTPITLHTHHTSRVSHITEHTSQLAHITHTYQTSHISHITHHTSHITHTSHLTHITYYVPHLRVMHVRDVFLLSPMPLFNLCEGVWLSVSMATTAVGATISNHGNQRSGRGYYYDDDDDDE